MGLPTETTQTETTQTETIPAPFSAQLVAKVFVEQYYRVVHESPEIAYRFYQDSSKATRQDSNGVMKSAATPQEISDLVLSMDSKNYIAEILFVDSQQSYNDGVFIQVTGCLTGLDKIRRKFTQSFFLAPQSTSGFFVLNDVFRYVDDSQPKETDQSKDAADAQTAHLTPEQEPAPVQDHETSPATTPSDVVPLNGGETCEIVENGITTVEEKNIVDQPVQPSYVETQPASDPQEDLPKKSYASIVVKGGTSVTLVHAPKARPAPAKPVKLSAASTTPAAPETEIKASSGNGALDKKDSNEEGYSVFIKNLPFNSTAAQVEEELKKFGPIKPGGVQVRNHRLDRFCFGFVEFESVDSMQAAIEASSVMIGGRQASIAQKKTTTKVGVSSGSGASARGGRYPLARDWSGSQNDYFRGGRGNFGGNQSNGGFTRNDFRNNRIGGDFSGRARGPPPARGRIVQNGYGRMGRPTSANQATVAAA